jgi:hypothetical protein
LAQIAYQENDCDQSMQYIREALKVEPNNRAIRELAVSVKTKREQERLKEKALYSKLTKKNDSIVGQERDRTLINHVAATCFSVIQENRVLLSSMVACVLISVILAFRQVGLFRTEDPDAP